MVMGYSGSDDFDIVPTLKIMQNLQNIIWINYIVDDEGRELIYEITADVIGKTHELDKVNQMLVDIIRMNKETMAWKAITLNNIREIYHDQGNYPEPRRK